MEPVIIKAFNNSVNSNSLTGITYISVYFDKKKIEFGHCLFLRNHLYVRCTSYYFCSEKFLFKEIRDKQKKNVFQPQFCIILDYQF